MSATSAIKSSASSLPKHYLRILRLWPADALRSITVHDAMRRRLALHHPNSSSSSSPSSSSSSAQQQPQAQARPPPPEKDLASINALYSLLENRYAALYPVSPALMRPASNPDHYVRLAAELEAAPRRSWLQNKWLRLSKLVRFA